MPTSINETQQQNNKNKAHPNTPLEKKQQTKQNEETNNNSKNNKQTKNY